MTKTSFDHVCQIGHRLCNITIKQNLFKMADRIVELLLVSQRTKRNVRFKGMKLKERRKENGEWRRIRLEAFGLGVREKS